MPLDPLQYSDSVVRVYERCVDELLVNLAKHFNVSATGNTASWDYEIMMLSKLGAVRRESAAIIAKMVSAGEPAIEEAVRAAMIEAIEENEPDLKKAALNGLLNDVQMDAIDGIQSRLQAFSRQAKSQLNLVNTTMLESTADAFRQGVAAANDIIKQMNAAQDVLNVQTGMVHLGTKTYQEAIRAAVKAMSDAGITGFIDRAGRKWSAEAYVRMNIQTTCGRAANQAVMDRNASYGNDIVWPRTNATARPGCYPWQGQLISMSNVPRDVQDGNGESRHVYAASETTYGQPAGIWGINCHHFPMNVFIPNYSYVRGEENKPPQAENDRLYQLTQEQRRLERKVRYAKRDAAMYNAAGDKEAFEKAALKVKEASAKLKSFVNAHESLVLSNDRTWVLGYNRSVNARALGVRNKASGASSGAKKTPGWRARHANLFYEEIRNRKSGVDAAKIAACTPFTERAVEEIRQHMFLRIQPLDHGTRMERFEPSYRQAQAWQRLTEGRGDEVDILLLKHEFYELTKMRLHGYDYDTAHDLTDRTHNWWIAEIRKRPLIDGDDD